MLLSVLVYAFLLMPHFRLKMSAMLICESPHDVQHYAMVLQNRTRDSEAGVVR